MYGKIFASMYDGSIYGQWKAIVTFQQMIALADRDGVIDITPQALSARTSIPLDIIQEGISVLESPDKASRTPDEDGRRIIRLDDDRPWGWRITNYAKYREIRTAEERREYHRKYYHEKRKNKNSTSFSTNSTETQPTQPIVDVDVDVDVKNTMSGKPDYTAKSKEILLYLNEKTGKNFQLVKSNLSLVTARLREGYDVDQIKQVITAKTLEWQDDEKMCGYLRPLTLFRAGNFSSYAGNIKNKTDPYKGAI